MMAEQIVIIGGGQAAAMAAAALRHNGFDGGLTLLSDEPCPPYERPPLSKAALLDDNPALQPVLPADWWQQNKVTLRTGVQVSRIHRATRQVELLTGECLRWDQLLLATGAKARPLPALDALGDVTFTLRHTGDAARLRAALQPGKRLIIVGGGTIGLELAASATQRQCQVSLVEMAPEVMGRNAPPPVRAWLAQQHRQHGVELLVNNRIEQLTLAGGEINALLQDGTQCRADLLVYGVGILANDHLAADAGLETDNGIIVDNHCRTSAAGIFAAGDVARVRQPDGSLARRETWENANRQARLAAAAMLGLPPPEDTPGWFWTDQYQANVQFIGEMAGDNWLQRGDPDQGNAIWFNLVNGALAGAVTLNQGRDIRQLRKLIQYACRPDPASLADPSVPLKAL
ncbi:phenylpropionate dioxygenase ferredoxin reductase subunit [Shimwellia pseudoproteus]|uniref:3-phenylpropionate/cinnamic acid dioxygenase ferredoxin--NAD(+) reductase subunit n=1 Tax=Shimwellia pseudoproteus TaxID=570012 RepID=UPI0018ECCD37|nr:3-phenylpropionate/cinnamic acid dioxygenase ferredoxin--NAD(+) reductase subunit [Shimwellia pseudoproteus]MBJ3816316.1 phenylpropionate dioxygenase ferredoxin reductase subunit [Shimwellia pseudoproteus]